MIEEILVGKLLSPLILKKISKNAIKLIQEEPNLMQLSSPIYGKFTKENPFFKKKNKITSYFLKSNWSFKRRFSGKFLKKGF